MSPEPDPSPSVAPAELVALRATIEASLPAYLADLERLVNVDCGSYSKAGVDEVGRWTAAYLRRLGARVEVDPNETLGDTIVGTFHGRPEGARLLAIAHLDTVFPPGTAGARPFAIRDGIATGPGVTDMKSGLLTGLYALRALAEAGDFPFERLVFVANPDEEIGSPVSGPLIRALAREADACLVLECARANGDLVSARKGILDLRMTVTGRAAHAGVEPEKGRSAILEAAHQVQALHALNGRWPGVTLNVRLINGGIRPNVVPESCVLEIDLRATTAGALAAAEDAIAVIAATTTVPDTTVRVEALMRHSPMERLPGTVRLIAHAQALAPVLGFTVRDAATGGAGDANTTAGLGVPTLDGLGPVGGNDHSPAEYLEVDSIVPRTALFAGLLAAVGRDPEIATWAAARVAPDGSPDQERAEAG
jgi:glutamate carboxypeptidase